jgi:hypothetical protein
MGVKLGLSRSEDRVYGCLRRLSGPKREEVMRLKRKLHSEEHHSFNSSPNINGMIKPNRMRRTRNVARMGEVWTEYEILVRKLEEMRPPVGPEAEERRTTKWA